MRFTLAFAALALLAPPPAAACSPISGYRIPTNMELVADADLILLATVTGGTPMDALDDRADMRIDIRPVAALKGELADAPSSLGVALAEGRFALLSNPYDLEQAHPLSYMGGCIRYMVPEGSRLLFLLDREAGEWVPAGGAFSRWAEDVLTDDAPWLLAVKFYIEVAALPESERSSALTARRDTLRAKRGDPVARLLADDIDRQLAGPNKPLRVDLPDIDDAQVDAAVAAAKAAAITAHQATAAEPGD